MNASAAEQSVRWQARPCTTTRENEKRSKRLRNQIMRTKTRKKVAYGDSIEKITLSLHPTFMIQYSKKLLVVFTLADTLCDVLELLRREKS